MSKINVVVPAGYASPLERLQFSSYATFIFQFRQMLGGLWHEREKITMLKRASVSGISYAQIDDVVLPYISL